MLVQVILQLPRNAGTRKSYADSDTVRVQCRSYGGADESLFGRKASLGPEPLIFADQASKGRCRHLSAGTWPHENYRLSIAHCLCRLAEGRGRGMTRALPFAQHDYEVVEAQALTLAFADPDSFHWCWWHQLRITRRAMESQFSPAAPAGCHFFSHSRP